MVPDTKPARRTNLCLLGGFALGMLAIEDRSDSEWEQQLFEHIQVYMDIVTKMDIRRCQLLGEKLTRLFATLGESSANT
jgi:hypothetical protein